MFLLKKLSRLLEVQIMIKERDRLIRYKHLHIEREKI